MRSVWNFGRDYVLLREALWRTIHEVFVCVTSILTESLQGSDLSSVFTENLTVNTDNIFT